MKWSLLFKEKMKAAIILVALMLAIIISNFFEKRLASRNDFTVSSIFEDRLQPSTDLYEMRTLNDQRLFILEEFLHANSATDRNRLNEKMELNHSQFDQLLARYQTTFLVAQERELLQQLQKNLRQFDNAFAQLSKAQSGTLALQNAKNNIYQTNTHLGKLNKLQSQIGKQLLAQYKKDTYYSSFLNTFQILLSVCIGFIILKMVSNSSLLNKFDKKINLN